MSLVYIFIAYKAWSKVTDQGLKCSMVFVFLSWNPLYIHYKNKYPQKWRLHVILLALDHKIHYSYHILPLYKGCLLKRITEQNQALFGYCIFWELSTRLRYHIVYKREKWLYLPNNRITELRNKNRYSCLNLISPQVLELAIHFLLALYV